MIVSLYQFIPARRNPTLMCQTYNHNIPRSGQEQLRTSADSDGLGHFTAIHGNRVVVFHCFGMRAYHYMVSWYHVINFVLSVNSLVQSLP
jgi:hypothetical protein